MPTARGGTRPEVAVFSDQPNCKPYRTTDEADRAFEEFRVAAEERELRLTLAGYGRDSMKGAEVLDGCYPMIRLHRHDFAARARQAERSA